MPGWQPARQPTTVEISSYKMKYGMTRRPMTQIEGVARASVGLANAFCRLANVEIVSHLRNIDQSLHEKKNGNRDVPLRKTESLSPVTKALPLPLARCLIQPAHIFGDRSADPN